MPLREPAPSPVRDEARQRLRQVLARTENWPEGALEACDKLADRFPDWLVWYRPDVTTAGLRRTAGYLAVRFCIEFGTQQVQAADSDGLASEIEAHQDRPTPQVWPYQDHEQL
jgi:hypothetical protein